MNGILCIYELYMNDISLLYDKYMNCMYMLYELYMNDVFTSILHDLYMIYLDMVYKW